MFEITDGGDIQVSADRLIHLQTATVETGSARVEEGSIRLRMPRISFGGDLTPVNGSSLSTAPGERSKRVSARPSIASSISSIIKTNPSPSVSSQEDFPITESARRELVRGLVVYVESPSKIYVREARHQDQFEEMRKVVELGKFNEDSDQGDIKINSSVVCLSGKRRWERGLVMGKDEERVQVRLTDIGKIEWIALADVRPMGRGVEEFGSFTRCVELASVEPAGGKGWSKESVWLLKELVDQEEVFIKSVEGDSRLAELYVEKMTVLGPTKPAKSKMVSVSKYLRSKGVALLKGTAAACQSLFPGPVPAPVPAEENQPEPELKMITQPSSPLDSLDRRSVNQVGSTASSSSDSGSYLSSDLSPPRSPTSHRLPAEPAVPTSRVFRAKLTNIDRHGTVWVVPKEVAEPSEEFLRLIRGSTRTCSRHDTKVGQVVVMRKFRCRGRVVIDVDDNDEITILDIDTGRLVTGPLTSVSLQSDSLADLPPRAIPLKLYGLMKTKPLGKSFENLIGLEVMVSVLSTATQRFPLTANIWVYKDTNNCFEVNLALELLGTEDGSFGLIVKLTDWINEFNDHGLDEALDPRVKFLNEKMGSLEYYRSAKNIDQISLLNILQLPYPLPLAVGQWLLIEMDAVMMCLVDGREVEPTVDTENGNQFWCRPVLMYESDKMPVNQGLETLRREFESFHEDLQLKSVSANTVDNMSIGRSVLAFYPDQSDWNRAVVNHIKEDGELVVFFTDYGHRGIVSKDKVRALSQEQEFCPVQVLGLHFKMPENSNMLKQIRQSLVEFDRVRVRVEDIKLNQEGEMVEVSFWKSNENGTDGEYEQIC